MCSLCLISGVYLTLNYVLPGYFFKLVTWSDRNRAGFTQETLRVGNQTFAYQESGTGEPLILLHGFGANKDAWNAIAPHLAHHYRLIAPDLPCFGDSSKPEVPACRIENQVLALERFRKALKLRKISLAGNSMGGWIAGVYASTYPEVVSSLWLIAPAGISTAQQSDYLGAVLDGGPNALLPTNQEELLQTFALVFSNPPKLPPGILTAMAADLGENYSYRRDIFEQLRKGPALEPLAKQIQATTLVTWGREDKVLDSSGAEILGAIIPNVHIDMLEGIGHLPMIEAPKRVASKFLGSIRQRP